MPHFSSCCGRDEYICQKCGVIKCSNCSTPEWRPDITGHKSAGNVCKECMSRFNAMLPSSQEVIKSLSHLRATK